MAENYENLVTPSLVRRTFEPDIMDGEKWIITICGRILSMNNRAIFKSKRQAVKSFYNYYSWKAKRNMHLAAHPDDPYGWWRNGVGSEYWADFKEVCKRDYGLKFIRI